MRPVTGCCIVVGIVNQVAVHQIIRVGCLRTRLDGLAINFHMRCIDQVKRDRGYPFYIDQNIAIGIDFC